MRYFEAISWIRHRIKSNLEGAEWSLKIFFSLLSMIYDINVIKYTMP